MSTQEISNSHKTITVAIATDTVLYTPFLLSYYGGDFNDTPYGHLKVNIISSQDKRFKQDQNLKGDGFATFCLLFGLADVAICDPSYLIYLKNGNLDIAKELTLFEKLLEPSTKKYLQSVFVNVLSYDEVLRLISTNTNAFFEDYRIKLNESKVVGNLIQKIAFSAVVNKVHYQSITPDKIYNGEKFAKKENDKLVHEPSTNGKGNTGIDFIRDNFDGNLIYYHAPSTGHCIGELHANIYKKKSARKIINCDFGTEFDILNEDINQKSIAITCDFIALDFINYMQDYNQFNRQMSKTEDVMEHKQDISEKIELIKNDLPYVEQIQDLAKDNANYMFTGILGNCKNENIDNIKAFLYAIDKNLFTIRGFLDNSDTIGLTKYLKLKFDLNKSNESELFKLLVAHIKVREEIVKFIDDNQRPDFKFDSVIDFYVKRLYDWRDYGNLYYSSTIPTPEDLKSMVDLRYMSDDKSSQVSQEIINNSVEADLISDWRKEELKITRTKKLSHEKESKSKKKLFIFFNLLKSPLIILNLFHPRLGRNVKRNVESITWYLINRPTFLYWIGVYFVIFELITGVCHLLGIHFPLPEGFKYDVIKYVVGVYIIAIICVISTISYELLRLKNREKYVYKN